jgi:hypothetical protein
MDTSHHKPSRRRKPRDGQDSHPPRPPRALRGLPPLPGAIAREEVDLDACRCPPAGPESRPPPLPPGRCGGVPGHPRRPPATATWSLPRTGPPYPPAGWPIGRTTAGLRAGRARRPAPSSAPAPHRSSAARRTLTWSPRVRRAPRPSAVPSSSPPPLPEPHDPARQRAPWAYVNGVAPPRTGIRRTLHGPAAEGAGEPCHSVNPCQNRPACGILAAEGAARANPSRREISGEFGVACERVFPRLVLDDRCDVGRAEGTMLGWFIDNVQWIIGWFCIVSGSFMGLLGASSLRETSAEIDPLRRAMLPLQSWIPVAVACCMIGFGALVLLHPPLATTLAMKPYSGVIVGIVGIGLAVATPLYTRHLYALVPEDRLRRWRQRLLISLAVMVEGVSLMGFGGGAMLVMPEPSGPAFRAAVVAFALGMVSTLVGALSCFAEATVRMVEQFGD